MIPFYNKFFLNFSKIWQNFKNIVQNIFVQTLSFTTVKFYQIIIVFNVWGYQLRKKGWSGKIKWNGERTGGGSLLYRYPQWLFLQKSK